MELCDIVRPIHFFRPDSAIDTFLRRKIKLSHRVGNKPLDNDTLRLSHDLGGLATYVSGNRLMGTSELLVGYSNFDDPLDHF